MRDVKKTIDRFEAKFTTIPECGCWIWVAGEKGHGYGAFRLNGRTEWAHRMSWKLYNGEIPDNLCVLHRCDTPLCVNPSHLFLGTRKINNEDRHNKGRSGSHVGEKNGRSKLTVADVEKIKKDPSLYKIIASKYGVTSGMIGHIKCGRSWNVSDI